MNNAHRNYLMDRFREEKASVTGALLREVEYSGDDQRLRAALARLIGRINVSLIEIEFQIERAFDDMAKEGGAP